MAVPTSISDLSTTANSNSPAGGTSISSEGIDNHFRAGYAIMAQLGVDVDAAEADITALQSAFVSVKDYGAVGNGSTDDTAAIQSALDYCSENGKTLHIPAGKYRTTAELTVGGSANTPYLTIVGDGIAFDGSAKGATIFYDGATNTSTSVIYINAVGRVSMSNLQIFANSKAGKCIRVTPDGGSFASFGWYFQSVNFQGATQYGFTVEGSSNGARFDFQACDFYANGVAGFYNNNPNSVNHNFTGCAFSNGQYGIWNAQGSYRLYGCEFSVNSIADNYIQVANPIMVVGCWSEQSNKFVLSDTRTCENSLTIINCNIASYPWAYWKTRSELIAQPTNDWSQWIAVEWNGNRGGLTIIGSTLTDPYNGAEAGATAPLKSDTIKVTSRDAIDGPPNFVAMNTRSQTGVGTFTETDFFTYAAEVSALRMPQRQQYRTFSETISGSTKTIYAVYASTLRFLMQANCTYTFSTKHVFAGDHLTIVFTQDGVGGRTVAFVGALIAGGSFVPTATANAVSSISFEFDGTNWQERSRALNLS
jgi:hypothetical protein